MRADVLSVRVRQLLVRLDGEVLSFNLLLEFFALTMAHGGQVEALSNSRFLLGLLAGPRSAILIMTILELVAQVEVAAVFGDGVGHASIKVRVPLMELVLVQGGLPVDNLMLVRALF